MAAYASARSRGDDDPSCLHRRRCLLLTACTGAGLVSQAAASRAHHYHKNRAAGFLSVGPRGPACDRLRSFGQLSGSS